MGQISKQLLFNAPLEKVWQIWTDVEKTPEWVEGVQQSKKVGPVKEGKGLEWQEKCLFGKQVIQMDHEFSQYEPLKKHRHTYRPPNGRHHGSCCRIQQNL